MQKTFAAGVIAVLMAAAAPAHSQTVPPIAEPLSLSGPRVGVTFLSDSIVQKLRNDDIHVGTAISQFGWQFEKQFSTAGSGPTLVTEWVLLVGGVDQGLFIPSASWLIGVRTMKGIEFGVGPNLTPVGAALVGAVGMTFHAGALNIPVNLAVVPSKVHWYTYSSRPPYTSNEVSKNGARVSLMFGFNTRRH
jgi:hypothetical protein